MCAGDLSHDVWHPEVASAMDSSHVGGRVSRVSQVELGASRPRPGKVEASERRLHVLCHRDPRCKFNLSSGSASQQVPIAGEVISRRPKGAASRAHYKAYWSGNVRVDLVRRQRDAVSLAGNSQR